MIFNPNVYLSVSHFHEHKVIFFSAFHCEAAWNTVKASLDMNITAFR